MPNLKTKLESDIKNVCDFHIPEIHTELLVMILGHNIKFYH